ncbi:MAG: cyanase [Gammaproteobacteria bacterium]|nr:cyanase [Gammaproteobacteria bacterium]
MDRLTMTEHIIEAKQKKGLTWEAIAGEVGMSPEWTTSACLGMNSMPADRAQALGRCLDLSDEVVAELQRCPLKVWDQTVPTDPLIYRMYEIMGVYGSTVKELIHEKFGDGIMSAIDFTISVDKKEDPKGDRVVITLDGKFLPYKAW